MMKILQKLKLNRNSSYKGLCCSLSSLIIVFLCETVIGQNQQIVDSLLNKYYNKSILLEQELDLLDNISFYHPNQDSALFYSNLLIKKAESNSIPLYIYRGNIRKGDALRLKGEYDSAILHYFKAVPLAEKLNYRIGLASTFCAIGNINSATKNYKNSITYYKKAIDIFEIEDDSNAFASALLNLGSDYILIGKHDSALFYLNKALKVFEKRQYIPGVAYSLGNIARIHSNEGNFILAEEELEKSIRLLEKIGDSYALASFKIRLASIERKLKKYNKALLYSEDSYLLSIREGLLPQQRDACQIFSSIYFDLNDFENAYKYQNLYYSYRDSIINEESIRKMADLRTEFEVSQKQAEIDVLVKKHNIQKYIGLGLGAILIISGFLLSLLAIKSKRNRILTEQLVGQKKVLQDQHDQLEELNKTKDRLFSIISHDLRGPIGVLNGTTMLIREYLESKDYNQLADLTANMEYSVKKVQHLLDNLLEWAVNQQGKFSYNPEKVEINEIVHEVLGIFEGMAISKNIFLTYRCKFDKFFVVADRNSLLTILRNLISNAIKFTNRNGTISVLAYKTGKSFILKISDTGVGIPQKKLKTLFKIDENKSTWGTEREKGIGLGLSLVNEFVKMNHGTIEVESEEGKGSTFTLKFPTENTLNKILLPQDI